jgi:flagellar basal body-associated protein FliL
MKKILIIITCVFLVIVSLSIAYYFVIFLPKQAQINSATLNRIEQSTTNTKENTQSTINTTDIQNRLDDINSALQDQQRETEQQTNCESNGGVYRGNGVCCLTGCR